MDLSHAVSGICNPPISSGAAWADYDADGDVDFFQMNHGGSNRLYRNEGDITFDGIPDFNDVALENGLADPFGVGLSANWIDYDNDGDQDLYVTNWNSNTLYQNQLSDSGSPTFVDVTAFAGLEDYGRAITTAWADFDGDGDLDVYLGKHGECNDFFGNSEDRLYENNADGTFTDVTHYLCAVGACAAIDTGLAFSPVWFDYDRDGDIDLYVVNDNIGHNGSHYTNVLWRNDGSDGAGGWSFTDVSVASGTDSDVNGMGLGIGDYNNDGWFDLAFSNIGPNSLLHNDGDGTFSDVSATAGIERQLLPMDPENQSITWGTALFDYNNDQLLDLYYVAGYINTPPFEHPNAFFVNNGDGTFTDVSEASGLDDDGRGRSLAVADFDLDGYIDLFVGNYGETGLLLRNEAALEGNTNHWIGMTLTGRESNRDAIGSIIKVTTPDETEQVRLIHTGPSHGGGEHRIAHFGLGTETSVDVSVTWPNGEVQSFGELGIDRYHALEEGFFLAGLDPNVAGQDNVVRIYGAEPGAAVRLYSGLSLGETVLTGCDGAALDLDDAVLRGQETADDDGIIIRAMTIPVILSGSTVQFQAVQQADCEVSNVLEITFD